MTLIETCINPSLDADTLEGHEQEGLVPFVVDAVYALGHALHNLLHDRCGGRLWDKSCIKEHIKGSELLTYIRNVSFKSECQMCVFASDWKWEYF